MTLPPQSLIEIPLLKTLLKLGGEADRQTVYREVQSFFPQVTKWDIEQKLASSPSTSRWHNRIQWARQSLVRAGDLARGERGVWKLTEQGRQRALSAPAPDINPPVLQIAELLKTVLRDYAAEYDGDNTTKNPFFKRMKSEISEAFDAFRKYYGLTLRVLGGMGNATKQPYINFLASGHTTNRGFYPGMPFDLDAGGITLKISDSDDNPPPESLVEQFQALANSKLPDFANPGGYPRKFYPLEELDDAVLSADLRRVVEAYLDILEELDEPIQAFLTARDGEEEEEDHPTAEPSRRVWLIAAGEGGRMFQDFYDSDSIALGWDELDDLSKYKSKADIQEQLKSGDLENRSHRGGADICYKFSAVMKEGDLVFVKSGLSTLEAVGEVRGNYIFDSSRASYRSRRKVQWIKRGPWELPDDFPLKQFGQKTLVDITEKAELVDALYLLAGLADEAVTGPAPLKPPYSVDDALAELFLSKEEFTSMLEALEYKKNLILQGPPGVGKTFVAKRLAYALSGSNAEHLCETVQFHQSYSYEDFVQGIRPKADGKFGLTSGVFFSFCQRAVKDPGSKYVLIIDEINRGNLSKILGELMLLLESDKRGPGHKIHLAYSEFPFYVPENLYVIGTMNTADRSLALIDYALRRRFRFVSLEPVLGGEKFGAFLEERGVPRGLIDRISEGILALNRVIEGDRNLGPGFRIGHSHFTPRMKLQNPMRWYDDVIRFEIQPLLEEYWFDDREKVSREIGKLFTR